MSGEVEFEHINFLTGTITARAFEQACRAVSAVSNPSAAVAGQE